MRLRKILATVLAAAMVLPMLKVNDVEAYHDGPYSYCYFSEFSTDFGNYLKNSDVYNPDHNDEFSLDERNQVTELEIPASICGTLKIYDVQRLNYLLNLKVLKFKGALTMDTLILDDMSRLEYVECYGSSIKNVSLFNCTGLRHLDLSSDTKLTSINLVECPNLNYLNIANTGINTVYVAKCPMLVDAHVNNANQLTSPYYLYAHGDNQLITNDTTTIVSTTYTDGVDIDSAHFPEYDMRYAVRRDADTNGDGFLSQSEMDACVSLNVRGSNAKDPTITGLAYFPNLKYLCLTSNYIYSVDVSHNTKLESLTIWNARHIEELDISNNPLLSNLDIGGTSVTHLYVHNNPTLAFIMLNTIPEVVDAGYESAFLYYVDGRLVITLPRNCQVHFDPPSSEPTPTVFPLPSNTPDGVLQFCERLYTVVLGRECDISGRNYWADSIMNGTTGADAAHSFFFSDEYVARGRTAEQFVLDLYRTFMNRQGSDSEVNYWKSLLFHGTSRESVFWGFVSCPEWQNICQGYGINPGGNPTEPVSPIDEFVHRMYTTCLAREVDADGAAYWAARLREGSITGTELAREFFFSQEFADRNYNNFEFIDRMYLTFMGRERDSNGTVYWMIALDSGATREDVFNGFASSPEFVALCQEAGINP